MQEQVELAARIKRMDEKMEEFKQITRQMDEANMSKLREELKSQMTQREFELAKQRKESKGLSLTGTTP